MQYMFLLISSTENVRPTFSRAIRRSIKYDSTKRGPVFSKRSGLHRGHSGVRGMNHEIRAVGSCIEDLANFVDRQDRQRSHNLRKQRQRAVKQGLTPGEHRLRSPQEVARRRRALFRHSDIPRGYFEKIPPYELDRFVDLMRWYLIEAAIIEMYEHYEIELINDDWYIKVSIMDDHRSARRSHKPRRHVKRDDRSFHGRPHRDRQRQRQLRVA